jgi:hypothetical protein
MFQAANERLQPGTIHISRSPSRFQQRFLAKQSIPSMPPGKRRHGK